MKRNLMVALCVVSVGMVLRAQEQPVAQPAAQPAAVTQPAAPGANAELQQQTMDLRRQIAALERDARKANPTMAAKLDELEKQRRQVFVQAKPELEALYAQQDALQEKAREAVGKRQGGGGKAGGKADRRAEKKAQKAATQQ